MRKIMEQSNSVPQNLSDDELMKMSDAEILAMSQIPSTPEQPIEGTSEVVEQEVETTGDVGNVTSNEPEPKPEGVGTAPAKTDETTQGEGAEPPPPDVVAEKTEVDYAAFYQHLTKPFKANGHEMQVTNPEDMIALMQMGANYHKKMEALKPALKVGRLLEANNLLDESQLGFLIDLHNKKPEAIAKLVKDSGIDLYEFNADDKANEYVPTPHQVPMNLDLQEVLEDLKANSNTFNQTINIVGNEWDEPSQGILAQHPELIRIIDQHIQSGVYEQITKLVKNERTFGRLRGVSDLDAYRMAEQYLVQQQQAPVITPPPTQQQKPQTISEDEAARRKAAAPPKKNPSTQPQSFNPFAMSDEEIMRIGV